MVTTISKFDDGKIRMMTDTTDPVWITEADARAFEQSHKRTGQSRIPGWLANNDEIGVTIDFYRETED